MRELEKQYNHKLAEYRKFEADSQMIGLSLEEQESRWAKLTTECDDLIQKIRQWRRVTSDQVLNGFEIEPVQLKIAS